MSNASQNRSRSLDVLPCGRTLPSVFPARRAVWPVFAWRVDALLAARKDRNPLLRSILRLAGEGLADHEAIAGYLGLHPHLVRHVQLQSVSAGLLDERLLPTHRAKSKLGDWDAFEATEDTEPGWIFREGTTGEVLPLFVPGSMPAPDRRQLDRAALPCSEDFSTRPTARSVAVALRSCQRLARVADTEEDSTGLRGDMADPDGFDETAIDEQAFDDWSTLRDSDQDDRSVTPSDLSRRSAPRHVAIVSARPSPIGLEVVLYTEPDQPDSLCVAPPLGGTGGWWYRRRLEWASERNPEVQLIIAGLLSEARTRCSSYARSFADDETDAFGIPQLETCVAAHPVARAWHRTCDAWRLLGGGEDTSDLVVVRCQTTLETLLKLLVRQTKDCDEVRRIAGRRAARGAVAEMAHDLGLLSIPAAFLSPGLLARASSPRGLIGLRDRALFLLVAAASGHCREFAEACYECPLILDLVDKIAAARNRQAHADSGAPVPPVAEVADVVRAAQQVVEALIPSLCGER